MTPGRTLTGLALCLVALTMLMACMEAGPPSPPPVTEAPPPPTYFVNVSGLALRSAPTTAAPQISTLQFNDEVKLMGSSDGWGRVLDVRRNISGWASLRYLQSSPAHRPLSVPRHETPATKQPTPTPGPSETPPSKPAETPVPKVM
jgi:Bacterial SH3 domain